jgi:HAMP domain-containing protein
VADNPDQTARARAIRGGSTAALAWYAEAVRLVGDGAWDAAVGRLRSGQGKRLADDVRRQVGEFLAEEERLDRVRADALESSRGRLNALFAAGGAAAVASTHVLAYLFRRGIGRRFAALTDSTRRLAAGEGLPPPLSGADEIAHLDRAFRDMAAELTRAADRVRPAG